MLTLVALLTMGGCATNAELNNTPRDISEFTKEKPYLESKYSDIAKYDRVFGSPDDAPSVQRLEEIWGKPSKQEKRWVEYIFGWGLSIGFVVTGYVSYPVLAIVHMMAPYPQEKYLWVKGDYEIAASGRSEMFTRYEDRIHSWEWKKIENKENSAINPHRQSVDPLMLKSVSVEQPFPF